MRNENKVDEMVDIRSSSHQYVPKKEASFTVEIPEVGATEMKVENMHVILLGGDQLTAESTCSRQDQTELPTSGWSFGRHSTRDGRLARQGVLYGGMTIRFHSYSSYF